MRKLLIVFSIIYLATLVEVSAQKNDKWEESIVYLTPEDEVLLNDKDARYLFKLGSDLGVEFKIAKALSVSIELLPDFINHPASEFYGIGYGIGLRYYYQMADNMKAGKQANNLSGMYIQAMGGQSIGLASRPDSLRALTGYGYSLGIGSQQRYLENEYFDFRLDLDYGINTGVNDNFSDSNITLRTKSAYGFVFGKRYKDVDPATTCAVIKCNQDRQSAFKFNRNDLFYLSRSTSEIIDTKWELSMRPRVSYEIKLGKSAFSFNQELDTELKFSNYKVDVISNFGLSTYNINYSADLRYYYKMKKKVLRGEQGNNLNGSYTYAKFQNRFTKSKDADAINGGRLLFGLGQQKEIVRRLYLDAKFGLGFDLYNKTDDLVGELEFAIGYMF